jgi:hypothetical protein
VTATADAPPVARCQFCRARLSRHGQQAVCCRACRRRHRCPICEGFKAEAGRTWCPACKAGYRLASRLLLSFGQVRPPDPAVIAANVVKYRRRAVQRLPLFEGP